MSQNRKRSSFDSTKHFCKTCPPVPPKHGWEQKTGNESEHKEDVSTEEKTKQTAVRNESTRT